MSQNLDSAQRYNSITELECNAAVLSVKKKFRTYVKCLPFNIITHPGSLKWLMPQKDYSKLYIFCKVIFQAIKMFAADVRRGNRLTHRRNRKKLKLKEL